MMGIGITSHLWSLGPLSSAPTLSQMQCDLNTSFSFAPRHSARRRARKEYKNDDYLEYKIRCLACCFNSNFTYWVTAFFKISL
ncbi:hypothetical protein NL676_036600 [Syzygium grande]|nr:hypothetical protein NL676_036600 [Syzygium grande]